MKVLEEFWYGNINPMERPFQSQRKFDKVFRVLTKNEEELLKNHSGIPHGGFVFRTGKTGWNNEFDNVIEYSLKLDSNPAFTSSVIVAYARAVCRMNIEGMTGCKTVFDVPPAYLTSMSDEEIRAHLL